MTSAITRDQLIALPGREIYDRTGDKVGTVGRIYLDGYGQPGWAAVTAGWFGTRESLVPLYGAGMHGGQVRVAHDKATIREAPGIDTSPTEPLTTEQVARLYQHYDIRWDGDHDSDHDRDGLGLAD